MELKTLKLGEKIVEDNTATKKNKNPVGMWDLCLAAEIGNTVESVQQAFNEQFSNYLAHISLPFPESHYPVSYWMPNKQVDLKAGTAADVGAWSHSYALYRTDYKTYVTEDSEPTVFNSDIDTYEISQSDKARLQALGEKCAQINGQLKACRMEIRDILEIGAADEGVEHIDEFVSHGLSTDDLLSLTNTTVEGE